MFAKFRTGSLLSLRSTVVAATRKFRVKKRFYDKVSLTSSSEPAVNFGNKCGDVYEINLDQRKVKTPLGSVLRVPGEVLALAVAEEWHAQRDEIRLDDMHLTALCNTAIDNPSGLKTEELVARIVSFLESDTILHREDLSLELGKLQDVEWGSVVDWLHNYLECQHEDGTIIPATSPLGIPIVPPAILNKFRRWLISTNDWALHGIWYAADSIKSSILTTAAIASRVSIDEAVRLSQLETEFQTAHWGRVEWAHDLDYEATRSRLAAAVLFARLNSQSQNIVLKSSR